MARVEVWSSLDCPFAYLAVYRLRKVWPAYQGRVEVVWRSLALEYINRRSQQKPLLEVEIDLMRQMEPDLPARRWERPAWEWPTTFWPAFEALLCAQEQGHEAAFEMSWALRQAFFGESRNPTLRHEILAIAEEVAEEAALDVARFEADWDSGQMKARVIEESRRGWHTLKVNGSPTLVLPDGRQVSELGWGEMDIDEERAVVRRYVPHAGDPLDVYREVLEGAR
jgi:predicted DsbA family dithiol-disulfide isomerase